MTAPENNAEKEKAGGETGQKLRLLLDKLHGEEHDFYDKLIQFLTERCQVTILKKKPLNLEVLTENDVFLLISPNKTWEEAEAEAVRRYVESHGGTLVTLTIEGRKPERLNQLIEPFGLSLTRDKVSDDYFDRESLRDSPMLEDVNSLAAGLVWGYASIQIAASTQAEVLLQYKDAILGVKRPLGKGAAYLFSCLPVFGKKQLDQLDNRMFLDNLLKSLTTPAMKETLEAIAKDKPTAQSMAEGKALAAQKIVGYIVLGKSEFLFFTSDRVILAKTGSMPWLFRGGLMGKATEAIYEGMKLAKLSELSPDKILKSDNRNFTILYDDISKFEIRKSFPIGSKKITISTSTNKYDFHWDLGVFRDVKKHTSFLVPLLSDKLSING